jgi:hypothetical protein
MCSKRNGVAGVRCHRTINWPIPVANTVLWAPCEPLRRHELKIVRPYICRDVYWFEIPPNRHVVPALETIISRGCFCLFLCFIPKSRNLLPYREIRFWNIIFFLKNLIFFSMLPSCRVIFPYPPHNSVMRTVPVEFVLCINN